MKESMYQCAGCGHTFRTLKLEGFEEMPKCSHSCPHCKQRQKCYLVGSELWEGWVKTTRIHEGVV